MASKRKRRKYWNHSTDTFERASSYRWQGERLKVRASPVTVSFVEPTTPPGTRLKRLAAMERSKAKRKARQKRQGQ